MVRDQYLSIVFVVFHHLCDASQYELVFQERLFTPCEDFPDYHLTKYVTFPKNFTILPDDNLYVNGEITIIFDFQRKKYPFILEFYKKGRGVWQKTLYSFKRADFCTSLFDKTEIWHTYLKAVPEEQRVCPLFKGQIFSLDVVTEQTFDLSSNSMEGEYLARLEMGSQKKLDDGFVCAEAYFSFYRV